MAKPIEILPDALSPSGDWYTDSWQPGALLWSVHVRRVLRDEQTPYQRLRVLETESHGRMMVLDEAVQVAESDEACYHELLVHPGLCRRGASQGPKRVLVIGGGDGGAAREALRHPGVTHVDLVDIDPAVTRAARDFFPTLWVRPDGSGPLDDDPRFHLHHEDGLTFLKGQSEPYDLIVVDSTDPVGPGEVLFSNAFYALVAEHTRPGGAAAVQGGSFWYLPEVLERATTGLAAAFGRAEPYVCWSDVYPGGLWNLVLATFGDDPAEVDRERAGALTGCRFYSAEVHPALFALGRWRRR
ncbi:MAG: spermidine synthase [Deltaproteobacteria bacterium]|nr:MAG: spermidine synthase [Deltaproteobacteria bacterium]